MSKGGTAIATCIDIKAIGVIWMIVAPALFLMAAMSRLDSDLYFNLQLGFFAAVLAGAYVFGISAFYGTRWSALGLFCISCLTALFFFGHALASLLDTDGHSSQNLSVGIYTLLFFIGAGLPFAAAARLLLKNAVRSREPL